MDVDGGGGNNMKSAKVWGNGGGTRDTCPWDAQRIWRPAPGKEGGKKK